MKEQKLYPQLIICKAIRLLNIIIHYEKGDTEYLLHEIRSYRRFFVKQNKLLKSEKLILKYIELLCNNRIKINPADYKKIATDLMLLEKDKYENQLLKYFDFANWISQYSVDKKQKQSGKLKPLFNK
jgi:hypothetical protein